MIKMSVRSSCLPTMSVGRKAPFSFNEFLELQQPPTEHENKLQEGFLAVCLNSFGQNSSAAVC